MEKENLEDIAVRCAIHLNEFFDTEDLELFVSWSVNKRYHPFQTMVRLAYDVKRDFHKGEFTDSLHHYMVNINNYYNAIKFREQDGKN